MGRCLTCAGVPADLRRQPGVIGRRADGGRGGGPGGRPRAGGVRGGLGQLGHEEEGAGQADNALRRGVCDACACVCVCVRERERERVCVRVCVVCVCVCVCVVCVCVCGTCVWRCERWRVVGSRELKSGGWLIHEERPALFTQTRAVSTQRGSTSPQAPSRGVHRAKRGRRGAMVYYPALGGWLLRVRWGGRRVRTCNGLGLPPRRGQGLEQFVSDSS